MHVLGISDKELQQATEEALSLNSQISFSDYLLKAGYTSFSPRLFMKENPLELIRLQTSKGQTYFRNFENKEDRGRLLDFIRNRSLEDGKIIPNKKIHTFLLAVEKAKTFLKGTKTELVPLKRLPLQPNESSVVNNLSMKK